MTENKKTSAEVIKAKAEAEAIIVKAKAEAEKAGMEAFKLQMEAKQIKKETEIKLVGFIFRWFFILLVSTGIVRIDILTQVLEVVYGK